MTSPALNTILSENKPIVLLISKSPFLRLIKKFFVQNGFLVEETEPEKLINNVNNNYYKIIILNDGSLSLSKLQILHSKLLLLKTPILYFYPEIDFYEPQNELAQAGVENFKIELVNFYKQAQQLKIIGIKDLLDENIAENFSIFRILIRPHEKILLDPRLQLRPLKLEEGKILERICFAPFNKEWLLVKGVGINSTSLLSKFQQQVEQLNNKSFKLHNYPLLKTKAQTLEYSQEIELENNLADIIAQLFKLSQSFLPSQPEQKTVFKDKPDENSSRVVIPPQPIIRSQAQEIVPKLKLIKKNDNSHIEVKNVDEELQEIFSQKRVQSKTNKQLKKINKTKKISKKNSNRKLFFKLFTFLLITALVLGGLITSIVLQGNYLKRQLLVDKASSKTWQFYSWQHQTFTPILPRYLSNILFKNYSLLQNLTELNNQEQKIFLVTEQIFTGIFQEGVEQATLSQLAQEIETAQLNLSKLQLNLTQKNQLPEQEEKNLKEKITSKQKSLAVAEQLSPTLSDLLAIQEEKNYFFIIQNSQELTSTGGSWQAGTLLTIKNGKLSNLQTYSFAQLSQKARGKIDSPADYSQFFGQTELGVAQLNWGVDPNDDVELLKKQLSGAIGKQINGVILLDLYGVEQIIKTTGNLEIDGELLNNENLQEKIFLHADEQVADKLGQESFFFQLNKAFLDSFIKTDFIKYNKEILTTLDNLLEEKHLLLVLEPAVFSQLSWNGELLSPTCPQPLDVDTCQLDSFYEVQTNLSGNYLNQEIEQNIYHQINFTKADILEHKRTITLENQSRSSAWPAGIYGGYMRFVVPLNYRLKSIEVAGQQLNTDQVFILPFRNQKIWGVKLELAPGEKKEIILEYQTKKINNFNAYAFFEKQQPGIKNKQLVLELDLSSTPKPSLIAPLASYEDNVVKFTSLENKDKLFVIQF